MGRRRTAVFMDGAGGIKSDCGERGNVTRAEKKSRRAGSANQGAAAGNEQAEARSEHYSSGGGAGHGANR